MSDSANELFSRTYRDRNVKYTKTLEEELARVRASEARLMMECEQMRNTIQSLEGLLKNHGESSPRNTLSRTQTPHKEQIPRTMSSAEGPRQIRVSRTAKETDTNPLTTTFKTSPGTDIPIAGLTPPSTDGTVHVRVCDLDPATVGMEFVLRWVISFLPPL